MRNSLGCLCTTWKDSGETQFRSLSFNRTLLGCGQKENSLPVYFSRGHIELKLATRFHGSGVGDLSKDSNRSSLFIFSRGRRLSLELRNCLRFDSLHSFTVGPFLVLQTVLLWAGNLAVPTTIRAIFSYVLASFSNQKCYRQQKYVMGVYSSVLILTIILVWNPEGTVAIL